VLITSAANPKDHRLAENMIAAKAVVAGVSRRCKVFTPRKRRIVPEMTNNETMRKSMFFLIHKHSE
jgi:hypothetical protein